MASLGKQLQPGTLTLGMDRKAFIKVLMSGCAALSLWPIGRVLALSSPLASILPGAESFRDFDFSGSYSVADEKQVYTQLEQRGMTQRVVAELMQEDFKNGKLCEVRGIVLSRSECVLLHAIQKVRSTVSP